MILAVLLEPFPAQHTTGYLAWQCVAMRLTLILWGYLDSGLHLVILHLAVQVLDVPPPLALETILCVSIGVWLSRKRAAAAFWADFALWQPLVP